MYLLPVVHVEASAVAPAAAHADAVGLVELAVITTAVALQESLLHALYCQVQSPLLTIHRDINKAAQGGVHPEIRHHLVGKVVLHVGVVLDDVVEAQLVEAVVGGGAVIVVKLDLEAVTVIAVAGHLGERGVSLGSDGYVFVGLIVDHQGAEDVFLIDAGVQKTLPVVHNDINGVDPAGVKEALFVSAAIGDSLHPQALAVHEGHCEDQGQSDDNAADPIDVLMS